MHCWAQLARRHLAAFDEVVLELGRTPRAILDILRSRPDGSALAGYAIGKYSLVTIGIDPVIVLSSVPLLVVVVLCTRGTQRNAALTFEYSRTHLLSSDAAES